MPTKIRAMLNDEQFREFCTRIMQLPAGSESTLADFQKLASEYGINVSLMGAKSFKEGPFARWVEKLERGRASTEALVEAARGGASNLDALEEVAIMELQDHVTSGSEIDLKFLVSQLTKLRLNLSMREESRRKQTDLERKLRESEKRIEVADKQLSLRDEQIAKLERERAEWAESKAKAKAALETIKTRGGLTKETLARIEEAAGLL
jgi:predicted RNA-binding protein with RPS1 domain